MKESIKGPMKIHYDTEGDYLEIHVGEYTQGYFEDAGEGIFKRIDEKTGKVTGVGILSFKKRMGKINDIEVDLPVQLKFYSS